ncbi:MAG: alkaline phosphatase D family protein [Planctomycetota bacterium]|jgi:alkaline phosphatase D
MNWSKAFRLSLFTYITLSLPIPAIYSAEQYKQVSRNAISRIVDGRHDNAIKQFENYLKKHPGDLESLYGLAVAYAQKKDIGKAMAYTRQAVDAGLPFGRFLAGPRDLLKPLTDSTEFKELAKEHIAAHISELLHGPMLGCVTDSSAKFWVRTANEVPVQVSLCELKKSDTLTKSTVRTDKNRDYTAVIAVEGLKPDTCYWYSLMVNNVSWSTKWVFRTFPALGAKSKFQIGFGGGAGYTPQHERMWKTIAANNLTAFLLLGDNVYIDNPTRRPVQQYCYYRRQSRPEFRSFITATPIYAIWDDHDFTTNDGWGGPEIRQPEWKIPVWHTFMNNWNNPYYAGGSEDQPGCWFDFSITDVDFFMLDGRYYRTNPKRKNPYMLGPAQKKWLFKKLKASKATFKVLASPVPWAFGTKPGSRDPWQGYKQEREEIFSFLEANKINGVFLISADRHRSDVWKIERPNGYALYEFESSKLTNIHTHELMPGRLFGYNKKCSFGLLSFDTTTPDPQVTYRIISIDNEVIYTFSLRRSQLTY